METASQIKQMVDQKLANRSFALDVRERLGLNPPLKITVIVDGDSGITIDDCANISRALSDAIHQEKSTGRLQRVTTPGDQPLKLPRQYAKAY